MRWAPRSYLLFAGLGCTLLAASGPIVRRAAQTPVRLRVDLSKRTLTVLENGEIVTTYTVAVGHDEYPTPTGRFLIRRIVWNPKWIPPNSDWARDFKPEPPGSRANPMKVVKMYFREPAYFIHGTDQLRSLGEAQSHGCIRMDPDDAYRLARYVMDHGGGPRDEGWFERVLHFRRVEKTVYLDNPVPLTIVE